MKNTIKIISCIVSLLFQISSYAQQEITYTAKLAAASDSSLIKNDNPTQASLLKNLHPTDSNATKKYQNAHVVEKKIDSEEEIKSMPRFLMPSSIIIENK